jgi:hypothetical protein
MHVGLCAGRVLSSELEVLERSPLTVGTTQLLNRVRVDMYLYHACGLLNASTAGGIPWAQGLDPSWLACVTGH